VTPHAALWTSAVLGLLVVAGVSFATPWRPTVAAVPHPDPARDLSAAEIDRARRFARAHNVPAVASTLAGLAVTLLLGLTTAGSHLASTVGGRLPWTVRVVLATLAVLALTSVALLPLSAWQEVLSRRYGLSVQTWRTWAADQVRGFAVHGVTAAIAMLALIGCARAAPRYWWVVAATAAAVLVLVVSFASPLVIEPLFNRFTPMPPGDLRSELIAMAARDGVRVADVLVADASRRTTALNAYVSGLGATRRIVVYDTLLARPDDEVRLVIAHELGHAARRDVLHGTVAAAAGSAAAVALLGFLLTSNGLLRRAGVDGAGDPRSAPLVLALGAILAAVAGPAGALVSRRVEARADVHSLDSTRDPAVFTRAMRELAVTNVANPYPNPVLYALYADHPSVPERIALARAWAAAHGVAVPPDLAPGTGT
jgi:STE24 endopeptidase